jgi:hypothetical protein
MLREFRGSPVPDGHEKGVKTAPWKGKVESVDDYVAPKKKIGGEIGRANTDRVTLPWRVLLSKTLPRSCLADFCSSGWTKFIRVLPMRRSACSAR